MQGVIAAIPTPVDQSGRPQRAAFADHGRWVLANGCDGLNVLGSTGEANSFDHAARVEVMGWASADFGPDRLMVGTGTPSLAETVALTAAADDLGYGVALVLPPYYYTPPSDAGLIAWYQALDAALGARKIRLYFYNYPQMTGFGIPVPVIAALHRARPERFCGIKDSSGDLAYCRTLTGLLPKLRVFPSNEAALAEARQAGFAGCISATANISAPLCRRLWRGEGDLLPQVVALRQAISAQPLIPSVKHMVARRSGAAIWENVLPPFLPLEAQARAELDRIELPRPLAAGAET